MDIKVPAGRYVLAVSGGVDSMVLLDVLRRDARLELIVAHFDHGIRVDSKQDQQLVKAVASKWDLKYETKMGYLGPDASEDQARVARYEFLNQVKQKHHADKIITAHHQDDLIETAILNVLRGTGRQGLSALANNKTVYRPLLKTPKSDVLAYAKQHKLQWREDSSNQDIKYLRNRLRASLSTNLGVSERTKMLKITERVAEINPELNDSIATLSHQLLTDQQMDRNLLACLPLNVQREMVMYWLKSNDLKDLDYKTINYLNTVIKTGRPGTTYDVQKGWQLNLKKNKAHLETTITNGLV